MKITELTTRKQIHQTKSYKGILFKLAFNLISLAKLVDQIGNLSKIVIVNDFC